MIVCDQQNPRAVALLERLRAALPPGFALPPGLSLVLGGDGFLLRTVASHGTDTAWLGLNAGNLGFLLNDASDLERVAADLAAGRYRVHAFPMVRARVELRDGTQLETRAVNDVYLERMTGQAAHLRLVIDGHEVVEKLVADGIVFATALGSTAYAYSAGGEPLHPLLQVLQVTPICAHQPRLPSVALPATATAEVEVLAPDFRQVRVVADGRATDGVSRVRVDLSGEVHLAYLDGHDFTFQMLRKVVHPLA